MAAPVPAHQLLVAETRTDRLSGVAELGLPPLLVPPISSHRNRFGAYTAAGDVVRLLVPDALARWPELVSRHEIELLSVAPELAEVIPATRETLTSLAIPDERTRFYSRLRTLRLSHGLVEFIDEYLDRCEAGPHSLVVADVHAADPTDHEFLAVLLRRIDPGRLVVLLSATGAWADQAAVAEAELPPLPGDLLDAVARFCQLTVAAAADPPAADDRASDLALARRFVESDGLEDAPECLAALGRIPAQQRAELHDARADRLEATGLLSHRYGAIPFHREHGSDPRAAGIRALAIAMDHAMLMGFYEACIDFCHRGRALLDPDQDPSLWWTFSAKLPTSLSILGRGDEAERLCDQTRAESQLPGLHIQFAYATAMLYTRHLEEDRRDDLRATAWINIAIALSSQVADPKQRAFHSVFNNNGLALIEAHRGRPDRALALVEEGLARLDEVLGPDEHQLHRSVLRYNRAQVLAGLRRLPEALADYRAVAEVDPHYPEYHFDIANLLRRMGDESAALAEYEEAMRLSPPFPEVYYNRADVRVGLGRWEEALADYDYVLQLDPRYVDAYLNRAGLLTDLGRTAAALTDVDTGLRLDPDNAALLALRARLAAEDGALERARTDVRRAIELAPEFAEAWAMLASIEFDLGSPATALTALTRSIELHPDPTTIFNRGCVHESLELWQAATADFDQVLAVDDSEIDALAHRANCRRMLGDVSGAEADVALVAALDPDRVEVSAATG